MIDQHDKFIDQVKTVEMVDLLYKLIQIESHQDAEGHEKNITLFLKTFLEDNGIDVELQEVTEGRCNLIARIKGDGSGPTLMLNGHTDTVPPYEMKKPFEPVLKDGKVYGRGSVDMKGALATMVSVLLAVKRSGVQLKGDLVFAATIGEENYSPGAHHLLHSGIKADYAIVGEPTDMKVGIAHKGVVWGEATFKGLSVHGSVPVKGINAIYKACKWIESVQKYYIPRLRQKVHPILGPPSINIGEIEGGNRPVIVPNECKVRFERRLLPNEKEEDVINDLQELIDDLSKEDQQLEGSVKELPVFHGVPHRALEAKPDSSLVKALCSAYEHTFEEATKPIGLQFWTDGALLGDIQGIQTVVCGPGNIKEAHSNEEFVSQAQLIAAYEIYSEVVKKLCVEGEFYESN